jgi:SET domain-containing protein
VNGDKGDALILLGNGSLYNHSNTPNIIPVMEKDGRLGFVAIHDIERGDELCFNYGYTPHFYPIENMKLLF